MPSRLAWVVGVLAGIGVLTWALTRGTTEAPVSDSSRSWQPCEAVARVDDGFAPLSDAEKRERDAELLAEVQQLLTLPADRLVDEHLTKWWDDSQWWNRLVPFLGVLERAPEAQRAAIADVVEDRLRKESGSPSPPLLSALVDLDRARALALLRTKRQDDPEVKYAVAALTRFPTGTVMVTSLAAKGLVDPSLDPHGLSGVFMALRRADRLEQFDLENALSLQDDVKRLTRIGRPGLDAVQVRWGASDERHLAMELQVANQCKTFTLRLRDDTSDFQAMLDAFNEALERQGVPGRFMTLHGGQVARCFFGPPAVIQELARDGLIPEPTPVTF